LEISRKALRSYPLCDRCLGRLYARLGYGWGNAERGSSVKTVLVMLYQIAIERGDSGALEEFRTIAPNIGVRASGVYRRLFGFELEVRPCAICSGSLDLFIEEASKKAVEALREWGVSRFVVGVSVEEPVKSIEEGVIRASGSPYYEELKDEISREVGKRVGELGGFKADFEDPEASILLSYPSGSLRVEVRSALIMVRYWKKWRMISQATIIRGGAPKYFSIQEASKPLLELFRGSEVVIHAFGREDIDARMLGSGRAAVVEVRAPRRRSVGLGEVEEALNKYRDLVEFKVIRWARRGDIKAGKRGSSTAHKIYRALVLVNKQVSQEDLKRLEEELRDRPVLQRTPTRALHRRSDRERVKRVYGVRCTRISENLIECIGKASGGLYIKELVSGDNGRTRPSFSEILGASASCIELDVLWTET